MELRSEDCFELRDWLTRYNNWLSHDIIDEMLELLANTIIRKQLELIKECLHYALLLDETSDMSRTEQVSICIRIVPDIFNVKEIFLGFYATSNTKSETLFKIVEDLLMRCGLKFENLRGQCYDGA